MAGPDLEINIKTRADVQALRQLETSLKAQIASLKKLGQDASGAESQLKKVQSALRAAPIKNGWFHQAADGLRNIKAQGNAAAGAITGFASLVTGPVAAVTAVVAALGVAFAGVIKTIHEYAAAERDERNLQAALARTGQLTEENLENYKALAAQLSELTNKDGEEWLRVLARLTVYGSSPESIGMDAKAVADLAGILDGDLNRAALMVGRAIQGNYRGFAQLGITVEETATQAEKLAQVYRELADRGGGLLAAQTSTLEGAFTLLRNKTGDLLEVLGQLYDGTVNLRMWLNLAALSAEWWAEKLGDVGVKLGLISPATLALGNAVKSSREQLDESSESTERYAVKLERVLKAIEKFRQAQDEMADAEMAARLAMVDSDEKRGIINPEQAARARYGIRRQVSEKRLAAQLGSNMASMGELYSRLIDLQRAGKGSSPEADALASQITDLGRENSQAMRVQRYNRYTTAVGAADDVFQARKEAAGKDGAVDVNAGFELVKQALREGLRDLSNVARAELRKASDQVKNSER